MKPIEYLEKKLAVPALCGCGCGNPLEKEGPHGPLFKEIHDQRVQVNTDCYFGDTSVPVADMGELEANGIIPCECID